MRTGEHVVRARRGGRRGRRGGRARPLALVPLAVAGLVVTLAGPAHAATGEDTLRPGEQLTAGQALVSSDGSEALVLQADGSLALFGADGSLRWTSGTTAAGAVLSVGPDGDVVLVSPDGSVAWRTDTTGRPGARLVLQDDGDLVVRDAADTVAWDSGTTVRPSILAAGGSLGPGQTLSSPDGRQTLQVLDDGDVTLLGPDGTSRWSAGTHEPGSVLTLGTDGNLVVAAPDGHRAWRTRTAGHEGASLVLQDDGDLVLFDAAGAPLWRSGTAIGPATLVDGSALGVGQDLGSPDGHLRLRLTADGLTLGYDGHLLWTAPLASPPGDGARLVVQSDGNAVLLDAAGTPLWATGTEAAGPGVGLHLEDGSMALLAGTGQELWRVVVPVELTAPALAATDCAAVDAPVPLEQTVVTATGVRVHPCLADAVDTLIEQARADGVDLHAWGWRSGEQQVALRAANCSTTADGASVVCSPPTAPPGTSRHERGLALDFTVDGSVVRPGSVAFEWLRAHAPEAGLRNLPSEAWHWSVDGW
ncbi:D-alanyl-D-alanine carboxypeptidase family protein [Cellulomonas sp.]|uniref:D-alanyl-D-alanine carboxypeptidase family protein n=1 Tax=Cellulomonas sp. TaxID=40001 RepID=UPI001B2088D8|nr:D-alanyl-D-alanine carboxypeptidase family protein [Cellulomonas sp.]MBO9555187.1 D-alanyl-D-alanine carboxypeptidase family protein [Cellulomonas sp.]